MHFIRNYKKKTGSIKRFFFTDNLLRGNEIGYFRRDNRFTEAIER